MSTIAQLQSDPFTNHIWKRLDPEVRKSLSKEQTIAVLEAIHSGSKGRKHTIDLRGVIPLFFKKYYFVFHFGRDTRQQTLNAEQDRRQAAARFSDAVFIIFIVSPFILLGLLLLYFLKSALGINIFPNFHLSDLWNSLFRWLDGFFK